MRKLIGSDLAKVAAMVCALAAAACGTDPEEDHPEAVKVELRASGQVFASYVASTGTWTGELEVDEGEETAHISVRFIEEDGTVIAGDEVALKVDVEDESIAEWEDEGDFAGHLHGKGEGETDVTFTLLHNDHAEFVTKPVHAHVHAHDEG